MKKLVKMVGIIAFVTVISVNAVFGQTDERVFLHGIRVENTSYTTPDGRIMQVFFILPPQINSETRVIFTMRGAFDLNWQLNPNSYRYLRPLSIAANAVVIMPAFNQDVFSYNYYRNFGFTSRNIPPYNEWSFHHIDRIFHQFVERHGLSAKTYTLFGHSLGGGFTSRTFIFSNSPYLEYAVASGARPDPFFDENQDHPRGIKNLMQYKGLLLTNLSRKNRHILIGENDTAPLADEPEEDWKGRDRVEGSFNFFESAKNYARNNNVDFNWELTVMPGISHSMARPIAYLLDIITGNNMVMPNRTPPVIPNLSDQERIYGRFYSKSYNDAVAISSNSLIRNTEQGCMVVRINSFEHVTNNAAATKDDYPNGYRIRGVIVVTDEPNTSVGAAYNQVWHINKDNRSISRVGSAAPHYRFY